jgi:hydroxyethylthiazole kinase-like uncharacterized protein yjeF
MRPAYAVERIRAMEARLMAQLPDGTLMERAAAGLATFAVDVTGGAYGARVVLLVGGGDNGGDALLAGERLLRRGARVDAVLFATRDDDQFARFARAGGRAHVVDDDPSSTIRPVLVRADLVIDGIVGIGGRGGLRPAAAAVVAAIDPGTPVIAVDVPSGVDATSGEVDGDAVTATATVCMGALKPGLLVDPGARRAGSVIVIDIGLDLQADPEAEVLDGYDLVERLPHPDRTADKYAGGAVGVVAGSPRYPGAATLAVSGAMKAGAGYVRFVGTADVVEVVRSAHPEVVASVVGDGDAWSDALRDAGTVQAWVVGPGIGTDDIACAIVAAVLTADVALVLDADALTVLAQHDELIEVLRSRGAPTVLTPHAGELARLLSAWAEPIDRDEIEAHRLDAVRRAADLSAATVLLKGSTTLVASPEREGHRDPVRVNPTGTPSLASAGTGDVLSGMIGALLAAGIDARDAASLAAYWHGAAAHHAADGSNRRVSATEVADALPQVHVGDAAGLGHGETGADG